MNTFGDFLFALRKEKGMTQAELAEALGVTNKAVSKWETGEAMPETAQLLPISRIFGVTVDELLAGRREEKKNGLGDGEVIKKYLFARGKEDGARSLTDKICGFICALLMAAGIAAYLLAGAIAGLWHPYWVIIPSCALACGIVGCIGDILNSAKREKKISRGENPYTGCACGVIMLSCLIAFLCASAFTGLWHPLWAIAVGGAVLCLIVGGVGDLLFRNNKDK